MCLSKEKLMFLHPHAAAIKMHAAIGETSVNIKKKGIPSRAAQTTIPLRRLFLYCCCCFSMCGNLLRYNDDDSHFFKFLVVVRYLSLKKKPFLLIFTVIIIAKSRLMFLHFHGGVFDGRRVF